MSQRWQVELEHSYMCKPRCFIVFLRHQRFWWHNYILWLYMVKKNLKTFENQREVKFVMANESMISTQEKIINPLLSMLSFKSIMFEYE